MDEYGAVLCLLVLLYQHIICDSMHTGISYGLFDEVLSVNTLLLSSEVHWSRSRVGCRRESASFCATTAEETQNTEDIPGI